MTVRPQLAYLGIYTNLLPVMEKYYTAVIGLVVTDRGPVQSLNGREVIFFSSSLLAHHQFVLADSATGLGPTCINQISFQVTSLGELRTINTCIVNADIASIRPVDHGNAWSLYSHDPDGNGLEIYVDTPWHVSQPHAGTLDLSLSDADIAAATEQAVRDDPSFQLREDWSDALAARLG